MMKENNGIAHNKDEFQLERIALFSDAVFAIAITLLIIEIKVPEIEAHPVTDEALLNGLLAAIPKLIGFIVSFFVISLYWMSHHRLFRYVHHYNQKLIWNNVVFLLFIVMMPFSTAVYSEYFNATLHVPIILYTINICCCGFYSYRLWHIVGNPAYKLNHGLHPVILRYNSVRALLIPCLFVFISLFSYINPWFGYIVPPFLPIITRLVKRHYYKKYPDIIQKHTDG